MSKLVNKEWKVKVGEREKWEEMYPKGTQEEIANKFIEACKPYLGVEIPETVTKWGVTTFNEVTRFRGQTFMWGNGEMNPLFYDADYAYQSRFQSLIAPPTILDAIRSPTFHGPRNFVGRLLELYGGTEFEFFDAVRIGDTINSHKSLKEIYTKNEEPLGLHVNLVTDINYWNQHEELVGTTKGTTVMGISRPGKRLIYPTAYRIRYTKEELQQIEKDLAAESRRGWYVLYWDDVKIGDKLTPVIKGPLTIGDLKCYCAAGGGDYVTPCYAEAFRSLLTDPNPSINPVSGWLEPAGHEHADRMLARNRGMPSIFDDGRLRTHFGLHLLMNWCGDDGWVRRMNIRTPGPYFYGDVLRIAGEVIRKSKVTEVGDKGVAEEYNAVNIKIEGKNQEGVMTTYGDATIYLPMKGKPVKLPIPTVKPPAFKPTPTDLTASY